MKNKEDFEVEINEINEQIKTFKTMSWCFIWVGVLFFICGIFYWIVDKNNFNEVGDFIGGVSGTLWALAGLFFIYIAFLGQKVQINYQREELGLTREELKDTKEVFKQQTQIMSYQQLDNTFFNLLDNHRKLVDSFKKGEKKYSNTGSFNMGGFLDFNTDSSVEIVSGYNVLENISSNVKRYFTLYSDYLKSNNIFDNSVTKTNPVNYLLSFEEIEVLFNEIYNILIFIDARVNKDDVNFYYQTLASNLTVEEKFLIEAYNTNCQKKFSSLVNFGVYNTYKFPNFISNSYIDSRDLYIDGYYNYRNNLDVGESLKDDFYLILDTPCNYTLLEFYFINDENKTINLTKSMSNFTKKNSISSILIEMINGNFHRKEVGRTFKGDSGNFDILIKSVDVYKEVNVYYRFRIIFNRDAGLNCSEIRNEGDNRSISDWVKDYFN